MKTHTTINPHPKNMDLGNLYQPFNRQSKDCVLSSKRPLGEVNLKRQIMTFSLILLWHFLLPIRAIADQCVEGDCVNGKGTKVFSTGHKYTGEFKNGKLDGEGYMTLPLGRTLKGRFRDNSVFEGTFTYPNGQVYIGQWEFLERNGRGTMKYADGRVYVGEFKSGLRHGKGIMTWLSGRRYEGEFVRGKRTGKGIMTYPDGRVYKGDFLDGEQSGSGVMTFPNGERLEGQFVDGKYVLPR
jgi:hypothetical protein